MDADGGAEYDPSSGAEYAPGTIEPDPGAAEYDAGGTDYQNTYSTGNHTVSRGDTLWQIARERYGDPMHYDSIARANNLNPNSDVLRTGQILTIPSAALRFDPGPM